MRNSSDHYIFINGCVEVVGLCRRLKRLAFCLKVFHWPEKTTKVHLAAFRAFLAAERECGKNGPCEARALIAVVNDYVFVDKIYSRDASRMGQAGTFWTSVY